MNGRKGDSIRLGHSFIGAPPTAVPELPVMTNLPEGVEEHHSPQTPKLTIRQRQDKLFEELDLSGLESWLPEPADSARSLLAEYHDVFSLEPSELGCTYSTEHVIKVTDDTLSRNDLDKFHHPWWKGSIAICKRCWIQVPYDPTRVCGVKQSC